MAGIPPSLDTPPPTPTIKSSPSVGPLGLGAGAGSPSMRAIRLVSEATDKLEELTSIVPGAAPLIQDFLTQIRGLLPQMLADSQSGALSSLAPAGAPMGGPQMGPAGGAGMGGPMMPPPMG